MNTVPPLRAHRDDHALLGRILHELCTKARHYNWHGDRKDISDRVWQWKGLAPISAERLERVLAQGRLQWDEHFQTDRKFLFMEPVEKGGCMVPVLAISYDFTSAPPTLSLRLALFALDDDGGLVAAGFRYETPSGKGVHAYCHAQLLTSFSKDPCCPRVLDLAWVPERQPALPLDAVDPVSLCASMLVSLYGPEKASGYLARLLRSPARQRLEHMLCWHYVWTEEPLDGAEVSDITQVSGRVFGGAIPDGIERVALVIHRESDGRFWNGGGWVDEDATAGLASVVEGKWVYRGPFPSWDEPRGCYLIEPRGCRRSGRPCGSQGVVVYIEPR